MIVKEGTTASGGRSSDGSEQEPLHLSPAGQPPSAQVPMAVGIYIPGAANGHVSLGEVAKYRFNWKISHQNGFFRPCGAVKKATMGLFANSLIESLPGADSLFRVKEKRMSVFSSGMQ